MSAPALVLLVLAWSALAWAGARVAARRCAPRTAQAIWRTAALLVPLPLVLSLVVPALPAPAAAPMAALPLFENFHPGTEEAGAALAGPGFVLPDITMLVAGFVAAGWAVRLALWLVSQVRLQRLKARAFPVRRPLRHWAEAMGLARVPEVRIIPQGAPFLAGLRRPAIFLPAALAGREGDAEIIVHEMVHLKRGDLVMRPLERVVADIFWFSPFTWAIRTELDYWREAVVDEAAADLTGDRIAYARALTRAARHARPVTSLPVAALVLKKEGTLKMRLNLLLTDDARPRRLGLAALAVLACAAPLAIAQGVLIRGPGIAAASPGATAAPMIAYTHPVLDKAKLTSAYGVRKHPVTGEQKLHGGVDLAEKEGTAIYAPASGTVTRAEYDESYGNLIEIVMGDTALRFGQLETMKVEAGDTVQPGETIATLGQSGTATGPHLHLEVLRGGERVDPQAEEGLVLAETLRIQAGAAPLAPMAPQPTRMAPSAPSPLPAVIPASAPLSAVAARLARPYASTAPAPSPEECPEAAQERVNAGLNAPDPVS